MARIGAVILAAGLSTRMNQNKLLLPYEGKTIVRHTVNQYVDSRVFTTLVVAGNQRNEICNSLEGSGAIIVDNLDYKQGMSTSVKAGIKYFEGIEEIEAVLISPADMPLVKTATINQLIEFYEHYRPEIMAPIRHGKRGHPVLFERRLFREITSVQGDIGAREIISRNKSKLSLLEVNDDGINIDIDSYDDYVDLINNNISR